MESSAIPSDDRLVDGAKRSIERRHSSAALLSSPPDERSSAKTATSYSFRERSPSSKSIDKKAENKPQKSLGVRFSGGDKHADTEREVKEFFLSVPMTASAPRRSSNNAVQWKEDVEMSVINGQHDTTTQASSPGWRRSATSLKSPKRQPVQQVSPPSTSHQRSQSMRVGPPTDNGDMRRRPNAGSLLQVPTPHRPRGTSLPSHRVLVDASMSTASAAIYSSNDGHHCRPDDDAGDYYLIRQFIVHGKGKVVNRGDSIRRLARNPSSSASLASGHQASTSQLYLSLSGENGASPTGPCGSTLDVLGASRRASQWTVGPEAPTTSPCGAALLDPLRVVMLGGPGVGKTALTAQFMTSEYLNTYEASLDDDACDRCVSVLLDGQESQLVFIDHPHGEISVENCMSTYNPHAYVIVYSVVDVESVRTAEEMLHFLWRHAASTAAQQLPTPPVVILVANKIDLVRSRVVTPQAGKSLATSFDCKYIETSSGMQHNVDELLVGILKQIRLKTLWHQQVIEQMTSASGASSSSSRSLFRKRSGRKQRQQQQQQQQTSPQHDQQHQSAEMVSVTSQDGVTTGLIGSVVDCCGIISSGNSSTSGAALSLWSTTKSPTGGQQHHRRSASLRVRKMLGKAVWTCTDYYSGKSRSCEDLHVL